MALKNSTVRISQETEEAVIEKAWRDHRIRSWQGAMDLAIRRFLDDSPADTPSPIATAPPGMRTIYVPASLPDELVNLLERAGREMAEDLAQGLDTLAASMKKVKVAGRAR